jgi:hypothetical protein
MDTKQALEEKRPESVRFLEKLRFRWVNQGQHSNNWHGYAFTAHNGHEFRFSYDDLAAHDTAWLKQQIAYRLRTFKVN